MTLRFPPNVRLATSEDLARLGLVATASYVSAPQFPYMNPYFSQYPGDPVAGFQEEYRNNLLDARDVVLVLEDDLSPNEKGFVCDELKDLWPVQGNEEEARKVVVAVTSLRLPEDCQWVREREERGVPENIPSSNPPQRASNPEGKKLLREKVGALFQKNLQNRATISTMVVHPAYRSKRHGDTLMTCVNDLFTQQGVGYYLATTPSGKKLYLRHGAREVDVVSVPEYSAHPGGFEVSMCEWEPGF